MEKPNKQFIKDLYALMDKYGVVISEDQEYDYTTDTLKEVKYYFKGKDIYININELVVGI